MLTERLRPAIDHVAEMLEADQDAVASALRQELAALVEQRLREHTETLEYLKDR
jgi:hypothetical protein